MVSFCLSLPSTLTLSLTAADTNTIQLDADEEFFKTHGHPLFSSHMIDLSEESVEENISTSAKYLKRAAPMKQ